MVDDTSPSREEDLAPGRVERVAGWAVGRTPAGETFAVSRRCRHQLADLSAGTVDADGCLAPEQVRRPHRSDGYGAPRVL